MVQGLQKVLEGPRLTKRVPKGPRLEKVSKILGLTKGT